ncbi:MAG: disulfide bond formation protein B [Candidatus Liptonbacteria bacterium]|nr:disulfide bond formation protein B [Candidatus Liptonbacteria bacterium]
MSPLAQTVTSFLGIGTFLADVLIIVFLVLLLLRSKRHENPRLHRTLDFLEGRAIVFAFALTLTATLSSLFYSRIAGLPPCSLCWIQRLLLFPQVLFLGIAWWFEKHHLVKYSAGLSVLGMIVSAYQSYLQFGGSAHIFCDVISNGVSCAQRYFLELGYITMPVMSFTIFALLFLLTFHFHPHTYRRKDS